LYTWTDLYLIRELLRTSGLTEVAVGMVGEKLPQEKTEPREDGIKRRPWKKKRQYSCRLFGMNSLKEGGM
jgi:hypothetical protein